MNQIDRWGKWFEEARKKEANYERRDFRRAVFLAVLPTVLDWDWTNDEACMKHAWKLADEAIKQEGGREG